VNDYRIFLLDLSNHDPGQKGMPILRRIISSTSCALRQDFALLLFVNARRGLGYILEV